VDTAEVVLAETTFAVWPEEAPAAEEAALAPWCLRVLLNSPEKVMGDECLVCAGEGREYRRDEKKNGTERKKMAV
jgi:hypothetical protein